MTLKKYNMLQIQRIINFANICHESPEAVSMEWVEKYSKVFHDHIEKIGIEIIE